MSKKNTETSQPYIMIKVPFEVFEQRILNGWNPYVAAMIPHELDEDVPTTSADLPKMTEATEKEGN